MGRWQLPEEMTSWIDRMSRLLDERNAWRLCPLLVGALFATGRRTVARWLRAGGLSRDYWDFYYFIGSVGRKVETIASSLLHAVCERLAPAGRVRLALDDTVTKRYGPCVEGAGIHHNPTPGPADQKFAYGHVWVTLSWLARHPWWGTVGLPLLAKLYVRAKDISLLQARYPRVPRKKTAELWAPSRRRMDVTGRLTPGRSPGAMCGQGENLDASGLVLVSPLALEIQEDAASGRVRVTVKDTVAERYVHNVHVKVIGSANDQFVSGESDLRGIFVADGIKGTSSVIARTDANRYAFYRGKTVLGNVPAQPAAPTRRGAPQQQEAQGKDALLDNVYQQNGVFNSDQRANYRNLLRNPTKGVKAKGAF